MKNGDKYLGTNHKIKLIIFVVLLRIYTHILYISNSLLHFVIHFACFVMLSLMPIFQFSLFYLLGQNCLEPISYVVKMRSFNFAIHFACFIMSFLMSCFYFSLFYLSWENYLMANLSHSETVCGKKAYGKDLMVKMLDTQILSLLWVPQHLVHADIRTYIILPHNYCLQGYLPGWNVTSTRG